MQLPTIKQLVLGNQNPVKFSHYHSKELWYSVPWLDEQGVKREFAFPVPISDAEGATFLAEDSPSFFKRWMRLHIEFLQNAMKEATSESH